MATLERVQAQIAKLQAQAEALVVKQSSGVVAKIRDIMEKHGLTTADIEAHIGGSKKRGRKPGVKVAAKSSASGAKYRDPKSGATWTGHGRAPAWIANAKDRSKFLTDEASEPSVTAASKSAKAGNYVRGPQAPKYRDPATGATWSGRGPAPAWLSGAKDRTAFLIEGGAGEGDVKPKAAKKAPAKKAVAKKVGATKAAAKKVGATKTTAKKVAAKKNTAPAKKAPAKKIATKKVTAKKAAAKKSVATPEAPAQASAPTNAAAAESTAA
ncbi:H-NS family nucleoid-associated regulatory protein [Paraburkholderia hospita]|uniref:H-NS family nucleoid-associated regulatory protein n=1 Tax=Paraburkholderia hospita TaxID=169430 RepID=UPI0002719C52|nr:H-NS family nucleoid-associated regulatory protein [Paraburkholderia hospita]EUC18723.1 histone family protein nucleoid-structuring protein H-NS [Burkholderia sp. BT03]SKC62154.1 DNA-binding protein H-NS [Paraburkholderia hospita]